MGLSPLPVESQPRTEDSVQAPQAGDGISSASRARRTSNLADRIGQWIRAAFQYRTEPPYESEFRSVPTRLFKDRAALILGGLVILHIVLHGVAFAVAVVQEDHDWLGLFLFMLGPSQAALLAFWVVLGGGRLLWRALPTALGITFYLWLVQMHQYNGVREADNWLSMIAFQYCASVGLLALARLTGLQFVRSSARSNESRTFQFGARDVLAWTLALAASFSVLLFLPASLARHSDDILGMLAGVAGILLVLAAAIFSSLGTKWLPARIFAMPAIIGIMVALWIVESWKTTALWGVMSLCPWLFGSFLLVRLAGYRATWQWRFAIG